MHIAVPESPKTCLDLQRALSALVSAAAEAARAEGRDELSVGAWATSETFYSRCGFEPDSEPYESNGMSCRRLRLRLAQAGA